MTVKQLFYLENKTIKFENYMEEFVQVLEAQFNAMSYENTNSVVDQDTTDVLYIDFEENSFVLNFSSLIDSEMILQ